MNGTTEIVVSRLMSLLTQCSQIVAYTINKSVSAAWERKALAIYRNERRVYLEICSLLWKLWGFLGGGVHRNDDDTNSHVGSGILVVVVLVTISNVQRPYSYLHHSETAVAFYYLCHRV